jgi:hypothetical protein
MILDAAADSLNNNHKDLCYGQDSARDASPDSLKFIQRVAYVHVGMFRAVSQIRLSLPCSRLRALVPGGSAARSVGRLEPGGQLLAVDLVGLRVLRNGASQTMRSLGFSTVLAASSPLLASASAGRRGGTGMEPAYPAVANHTLV